MPKRCLIIGKPGSRMHQNTKFRMAMDFSFHFLANALVQCSFNARKVTFDVKAAPFSSCFGFSFKIDYEENIKYNSIQFCFSYSYDVSKTKVTC